VTVWPLAAGSAVGVGCGREQRRSRDRRRKQARHEKHRNPRYFI
jgi:hypothetical protein